MSQEVIAFSEGPMSAAAQMLNELGSFINNELETLLGQARQWAEASSGATKAQAQQAIVAIQKKQTELAAFSVAYGRQVMDSSAHMASLDRSLAQSIDVMG